jgi:hypothetical protein
VVRFLARPILCMYKLDLSHLPERAVRSAALLLHLRTSLPSWNAALLNSMAIAVRQIAFSGVSSGAPPTGRFISSSWSNRFSCTQWSSAQIHVQQQREVAFGLRALASSNGPGAKAKRPVRRQPADADANPGVNGPAVSLGPKAPATSETPRVNSARMQAMGTCINLLLAILNLKFCCLVHSGLAQYTDLCGYHLFCAFY